MRAVPLTTGPSTPATAAESHALNTVTYYYLSEDDKEDAADPGIGRRRVPQLGPTQHHSEVTPVTHKPDVKPGAYFFFAAANGGRNIEERYLANNVRAVKVTEQPADPPKKKERRSRPLLVPQRRHRLDGRRAARTCSDIVASRPPPNGT